MYYVIVWSLDIKPMQLHRIFFPLAKIMMIKFDITIFVIIMH